MKKLLFALLILITVQSFGQNPTNYQYRTVRERLLAFMVDSSFHLPRYNGTPVGLRVGSSTMDGAMAADTLNGRIYQYWNGSWVRLANYSEVAAGGANIYNSDGILTGNRILTGLNNTYYLAFDSLDYFRVARDGVTRIYSNNSTSSLYSPDGNTLLNITNGLTQLSIGSASNYLWGRADSFLVHKIISYEGNIHSTFNDYSLVDKSYVDSSIVAGSVDISGKLNISDTSSMLSPYLRGATEGFGIDITGTQHKTWLVDSFSVATRAVLYKVSDSLGALIGGGTPSLQDVTDVGSTTDNSIQITDASLDVIDSGDPTKGISINKDYAVFRTGSSTTSVYLHADIISGLDRDLQLPNESDTLATRGFVRSLLGGGSGYTTLAQFTGETNWTTGYINGSGDYTELPLGSSGKVLTSNGASSAPSWETPATGNVTKVGTPVNNQIGIWTGDGTIEGVSDLTFDGAELRIGGFLDLNVTGNIYTDNQVAAGWVRLTEAASFGSVSSGFGAIWVKDDGTLHFKNDAGTDIELGAGGAGYTTLSQFVGEPNWKVYHSDGSGDIQAVSLGAAGSPFYSTGTAAAPAFFAPLTYATSGNLVTLTHQNTTDIGLTFQGIGSQTGSFAKVLSSGAATLFELYSTGGAYFADELRINTTDQGAYKFQVLGDSYHKGKGLYTSDASATIHNPDAFDNVFMLFGDNNVRSVFASGSGYDHRMVAVTGNISSVYTGFVDGGGVIMETNQALNLGTNKTVKAVISAAGALKLTQYGSGTFTGTATKFLAVDASGNVIEETGGGSGETNTASNLGGGLANYSTKVGVDLRFNSFDAADFDLASNLISIDATKWLTSSAAAAAYQPLDGDLTTIAGLTATTDNFLVSVSSAWASRTPSQVRTTLGLVIGTDVQAWDADLDYLAGFTPSANVKTILNAADYAAVRTALSLVIGTNVEAWDADLDYLAGFTPSANVKTILNAVDYAAVRTALSLTIGTDVQAYDADLTTWAGITPGSNVGTFLATPSSANLATAVTDETGTGALVFGTSPTLTEPKLSVIKGTNSNIVWNFVDNSSAVNYFQTENATTGNDPLFQVVSVSGNVGINFKLEGTGKFNFLATTQGPTEIRYFEDLDNGSNYVGVIAPASLGSNITITLPNTSGTLAITNAAQTFTGSQTFASVITTNTAVTAAGNAATVAVTASLTTVTNNSAATLTITLTTASAVDGQISTVRILDFSGVAQTIVWVNTENSSIAAPTTSNGSTTLFLTVRFMYNSATSKWRCIGFA